jgi:hypothetical protein
MRRALPSLSDFPIPADVVPGAGWCELMREMADHIGPVTTLMIVEHFKGQNIYVPADAAKSPFLPLIGAEKARVLAWVYRRETLAIPTAAYALARARRGPVMASVRRGDMTVSDAARILGVRRDYASRLLSKTDEGRNIAPSPATNARHDPRQGDLFALF